MAKHANLVHGFDNTKPEFDVRIVKFCKTAIERQVLEAVRIASRAGDHGVVIMNSKSEFNRCTIPRIVMFLGDQTDEVKLGLDNEVTKTGGEDVLPPSKKRKNNYK